MNASFIIRVSLAVVLGLIAPIAFIVGGSLFENTSKEAPAGYIALALFCAVCQLLLGRKRRGGTPSNWPILAVMIGALLAGRAVGLSSNWLQFVAATSGAVAAAVGRAVLSPKHVHV
jgi:drug/metabolite transporter (DMT)-like permease